MVNAERPPVFDYISGFLGLILLFSLAVLILDRSGKTVQIKQNQKQINSSYATILQQSKKDAVLLFELQYNNPEIVFLLDKVESSLNDAQMLKRYRQQLRNILHLKFQTSRQYFPKQRLYLPDGRSLLSLDSPSKAMLSDPEYNVGLQKVLAEKIPYFGLALLDGVYVYRFFFPIFNDYHELTAAAEVSLPLKSIQSFLFAEHGTRSRYLFAKRPLSDVSNKWSLYQESILSDDYYVHKQTRKTKKYNMYLDKQQSLQIKNTFTESHLISLFKMEEFSFEAQLNDTDGFVSFLPLKNINGDLVGQLLTYTPNLVTTSVNNNRILLFVTLFVSLLLSAVFYYRKSGHDQYMVSFYKSMIDALPFPVFSKDKNNHYQHVNDAFLKHFNLTADTNFDDGGDAFEKEPECIQISAQELMEAGGSSKTESEVIEGLSSSNFVTSLFVLQNQHQSITGLLGFISENTEKKSLKKALAEALFFQQQLLNLIPMGVRLFNADRQISEINQAFELLSGFNKKQMLSADCENMFTCLQCNPEECPLRKTQEDRLHHQIETVKYKADGEVGTFVVSYAPLQLKSGEFNGIIELTTDISDKKSLLDKTRELIINDELTGLLNMRGLLNIGANYFRLSERTKKPFFALYFDIFGMKKLNYQFGEKAGDQLLKDFTEILKDTFRDTDLIARVGGDEFAVLLNESDYRISDRGHFTRLEHNVQKYNQHSSNEYKLVLDTGIVEYSPQLHVDLQELISESEKLVYEQKLKRNIS
ncbi:sensor domain-containing diguanylate cyclase [Psychromonas aquimarina]|uniref:sensor domain-containing diguanylate cyclase n=1 Tax=Psychromonas aquimarina TaxID=444919 RepID=UPI0004233D64|nr:diguanylate cyclase [Psychromonas aquimarina]